MNTLSVWEKLVVAMRHYLPEKDVALIEERNKAISALLGDEFWVRNFGANTCGGWRLTKDEQRLLDMYSGPHGRALCRAKRIMVEAQARQPRKKAST